MLRHHHFDPGRYDMIQYVFAYMVQSYLTHLPVEEVAVLLIVSCSYSVYRIVSKFIEAELRIYVSVKLPALVQMMAWRLVGAKPLSEPMLEYC